MTGSEKHRRERNCAEPQGHQAVCVWEDYLHMLAAKLRVDTGSKVGFDNPLGVRVRRAGRVGVLRPPQSSFAANEHDPAIGPPFRPATASSTCLSCDERNTAFLTPLSDQTLERCIFSSIESSRPTNVN